MKSTSSTLLAASLVLAALGACTPRARETGAFALPFVENDFAAALSRAREADLPLFVEVWAPW